MHLAKCITKVEKLELYDCGIGARGVELLSQGIMRRDHPVITALIYIFFWLLFLCGYVVKRRVKLFGLGNVAQLIRCVFGLTASR